MGFAPNENDGVGTSTGFAIGGGTVGAAVTVGITAAVVAPNENDGFVDSVGVATTGGTMGVAPNESIGGAACSVDFCSSVDFVGSGVIFGVSTVVVVASSENFGCSNAGFAVNSTVVTGFGGGVGSGVGGGVGTFGTSKKPTGTLALRLMSPLFIFGCHVPFHFFGVFSSGLSVRLLDGFGGETVFEVTVSGFGLENSCMVPLFFGVAILINLTGAHGFLLAIVELIVLALSVSFFSSNGAIVDS